MATTEQVMFEKDLKFCGRCERRSDMTAHKTCSDTYSCYCVRCSQQTNCQKQCNRQSSKQKITRQCGLCGRNETPDNDEHILCSDCDKYFCYRCESEGKDDDICAGCYDSENDSDQDESEESKDEF